jgi:hypothetical protein
MSDYSRSALEILRQPAETMKWYIIPIFLIVVYLYAKEIKARNWSVVLGGLALWGMDLFNEIWNSIVFHASGFAPVWGTPMGVGDTSLLLLIGYNIEISFMFAVMGLLACTLLPEDKKKKIFGINNRVLFAVLNSIAAVAVECFLNHAGILTWEYAWWSIKVPYLIFLIGYLPFFVAAYIVHDLPTVKKKVIAVSSIIGFDVLLLIIFGAIGWM